MVNGVLYSTAGTRRAVVALDAATGELLWMHSEDEGKRGDSGAPATLRPRACVLDRRQAGADSLRDARLQAGRARCEDRRPGVRLRQERHRRSEARKRSADGPDYRRGRTPCRPGRGQGHRHRRRRAPARRHAQEPEKRERLRPRVRRAGPASVCGSSTRFRSPGSTATRPGRTIRGRTPATPACGARSPSTKSWAWCTCRWRCRRATTTAAIGRATISSARASSRWTSRPASGSGTISSFTTTSGTGIFRARRFLPTSW